MGNLNLKIKVIFDFDENEFVCFIDGVYDLEGRGQTESLAIQKFMSNYEEKMNDN